MGSKIFTVRIGWEGKKDWSSSYRITLAEITRTKSLGLRCVRTLWLRVVSKNY